MSLPSLPSNFPRPEYVWPVDRIFAFFDTAEGILESPLNESNGDQIAARLADLLALYPSSSNACASADWYADAVYRHEYDRVAKALKEKENAGEFPEEIRKITSVSILNKYITSRVSDFTYIKTRADRLNRAITHSLDGIRSLLSKAKEERRVSNYAGQA